MLILWLKFIVAAAVVVFCGYRICIHAEKIAAITKVGRTFIGLALLAAVTSLPELAVGIGAVKIQALDLALGDFFGSNLFNLTIVGIIFLGFVKQPKVITLEPVHIMSAALSTLLIALAAVGIVFYSLFNPGVAYSKFLLDAETALILGVYIFGTYLIFRSERARSAGSPKATSAGCQNVALVWLKFLFYAVVLVGFAVYLSQLGVRIARIPVRGVALGGTFVGSLFMALTTSLPEVTVAISAVRMGFPDMALGNIFGSNMFNMGLIPIMDLVLGRKVILSSVSALHLFTVLFVIISTALVISGLVYRSRRKTAGLSWDSAGVLFIYFAANLVNFYLR